MAAMTNVPSKR